MSEHTRYGDHTHPESDATHDPTHDGWQPHAHMRPIDNVLSDSWWRPSGVRIELAGSASQLAEASETEVDGAAYARSGDKRGWPTVRREVTPSEQVAIAMKSLRAGAQYDATMKRLQARLEVSPEEVDYLVQRALENARRQAELRNVGETMLGALRIYWLVDHLDRLLRRWPRLYDWLGRAEE